MHDDLMADNELTVPNNRSLTPDDETRWAELNTQVNGTVASTPYYPATLPPPPPLVRESAARERMRRRHAHARRGGGEWAWVIIAAAMLGVVITISMSVFLVLRASKEEQEVIPTAAAVLPTPVDVRSDFSDLSSGTGQEVTLDDGRSIVLQPWNGASRFTVLMMGLDRRPGETGLAYRTDTMMLVSIDPEAQTVGILSVPRDLFVEVPGYRLQRINSAMVLGELQQTGYGPTLAMQTAQYNFGIHVHDYVAVDFNAFITLVDAIGGIDVNVPYIINDPQYPTMNYGYEAFYLPAGLQHLDGATALKFARTRHGNSDFQRAERQQMVIYAVRDRILDLEMLPQLIVQSPTLLNQLSENVYTGLTIDQMIQLAWYLKDIPEENIHTGVLNQDYTIGWQTPEGAAVEIPDRARIGSLMVEVFGSNYSE